MPIRKTKDGYLVEVNRKNVPRIRRNFSTLKAAEDCERNHLAKHLPTAIAEPEAVVADLGLKPEDNRTTLQLLDLWWRYHGVNLANGVKQYAMLESMLRRLEHKIARTLEPVHLLEYRYAVMHTDAKPISAKSFNNRHGYLAAMYRSLKTLKMLDYNCPIGDVEMIKIQERQLSYLNSGQIETLFTELKSCRNKYVWWIAQLCIRTGARWGEAETLKRKQLHNGRVTFEFTKSKKVRTVPLDPVFYAALVDFARLKNPEELIFKIGYKAFERVVGRLDLHLPKGQLTHILRHTFASHFIMNGGNILTLKDILGHSDIKQTMRYAHLSPSHLIDAVNLNPMINYSAKEEKFISTFQENITEID